VIASQALITAAFSVTKQVVQLGYLPRLRLLHTSVRDTGQIYVPFVNWALYLCVVFAVVMFGSSSALASAYGIAVTIDMTITTLMTFFVIRWAWKLPLWLCVGGHRLLLRGRHHLPGRQWSRCWTAAGSRCSSARDVHADGDLEARPPADGRPDA
jgi:K+ transporter